jgi:hypothetical protein
MIPVLIVMLVTFGLCFAVDKGFTKIFRGKKQHKSGLSVGLNKKYALFGLIFTVLGIAALLVGIRENSLVLMVGGGVLVLLGICLIVYFLTFGIFYDEDGFILTTFGKKSTVYAYRDIRCQQLYNAYGATVIELHMCDGRAVQLQAAMEGVYPFLDKAFEAWLEQTGRTRESCTFHDPENSCWFPSVED